jgi:hypothetical protein
MCASYGLHKNQLAICYMKRRTEGAIHSRSQFLTAGGLGLHSLVHPPRHEASRRWRSRRLNRRTVCRSRSDVPNPAGRRLAGSVRYHTKRRGRWRRRASPAIAGPTCHRPLRTPAGSAGEEKEKAQGHVAGSAGEQAAGRPPPRPRRSRSSSSPLHMACALRRGAPSERHGGGVLRGGVGDHVDSLAARRPDSARCCCRRQDPPAPSPRRIGRRMRRRLG